MSKKILFVLNNFNIGGPQKSLLSLLHNFPSDYEVDLLVLNGEETLKKYLPSNVNLKKADSSIPLLMVNKNNLTKTIIKNINKQPILLLKLLKLIIYTKIKNESFTVAKQKFWMNNHQYLDKEKNEYYDYAIAVSGGHSMMYIVDFVQSKNKISWIRTEYQNLGRNLTIDNYYFEQVEKILSVSKQCTKKFQEFFPEQEDKIRTFYNPLPFKMYERLSKNKERGKEGNMENGSIFIVTISRLDENKGFDILLETAKHLKTNNINFIWKIYGLGPMESTIKNKISDYGLENHLFLMGFVLNTGEVLKKANLLVHPSKFEGKSNTIDEAKYYNLPIVSTRFPTVYEQIKNRKTGLVTDLNPKALYEGIVELLDDKELQNEIRENLIEENKINENRNPFNEFMNVIGAN